MRVPGVPGLFVKMWDPLTRKLFGEKNGFQNVFYPKQKDEFRMDIISCPYVRYFKELGCPELTKIYCTCDDKVYGRLPGLRFQRNETIGRGGERCDFCIRRIRRWQDMILSGALFSYGLHWSLSYRSRHILPLRCWVPRSAERVSGLYNTEWIHTGASFSFAWFPLWMVRGSPIGKWSPMFLMRFGPGVLCFIPGSRRESASMCRQSHLWIEWSFKGYNDFTDMVLSAVLKAIWQTVWMIIKGEWKWLN